MLPDLFGDLDRLRSHLPCLDRAAADESADPRVRARVAAEARLARAALALAGQYRTFPERDGAPVNETERLETTEVTPHGNS